MVILMRPQRHCPPIQVFAHKESFGPYESPVGPLIPSRAIFFPNKHDRQVNNENDDSIRF